LVSSCKAAVSADDEHLVVGDGAEGLVKIDHGSIKLASRESATHADQVS